MRVLIVTRIFPNASDPVYAPYHRQQFRALADHVEVEVLAPIPFWKRGVPRREVIDGMAVAHPRYAYVPKLPAGNAALYAASLLPEILARRGRFDVLLAAFAFPDGVAAVGLAKLLGIPCVVKVIGSDINVLAGWPTVAANLRLALPRAARVVAVSQPLVDAVAALGVDRARIDLVHDGVNTQVFRPTDRAAARAALGHAGDARRWIVFVGRLEPQKGVLDLLAAFETLAAQRPDVRLVMVGDGASTPDCQAAARRLGDRIIVTGNQPLDAVARWIAASEILTLPSWNEGTPNVVREALASGRRVVASRVGGVPALLPTDVLGDLVPARDRAALAAALARAVDSPYDPAAVAAAAGFGSWTDSARQLEAALRAAVE